ncbi:hypothetical protein [Flavihumibacter fluvii]|uniref:hypothetical protein n=1 Tax=Flavihumibacter fluvii TaxID=2838157 RepID=UPI001BDF3828|nr:hypothetical protein [Flavihumibacter fluvii]ULQ50657.1 hypothetical protein KJS93_11255 [Flavihumibacter fluvii]
MKKLSILLSEMRLMDFRTGGCDTIIEKVWAFFRKELWESSDLFLKTLTGLWLELIQFNAAPDFYSPRVISELSKMRFQATPKGTLYLIEEIKPSEGYPE